MSPGKAYHLTHCGMSLQTLFNAICQGFEMQQWAKAGNDAQGCFMRLGDAECAIGLVASDTEHSGERMNAARVRLCEWVHYPSDTVTVPDWTYPREVPGRRATELFLHEIQDAHDESDGDVQLKAAIRDVGVRFNLEFPS